MKDPAILFYSKDWLEGTADMFPEEKGVYFDLLMHQHQKGYLPNDAKRLARLVGLSREEFDKVWAGISRKFIAHPSQTDALINRRMDLESSQRGVYKKRQSTSAIVGNWFKYSEFIKKSTADTIAFIKKEIDYDYLNSSNFSSEEIHKYLINISQTVADRSHIANGDVNANEDVNKNAIAIKKKRPVQEIDFAQVGEIFNTVCKDLPPVEKISDTRKSAIKARAKEYGLEAIGTVFLEVSKSNFLNGDNDRGWRADFDWIMKPANFLKIKEGKYKSTENVNRTNSNSKSDSEIKSAIHSAASKFFS